MLLTRGRATWSPRSSPSIPRGGGEGLGLPKYTNTVKTERHKRQRHETFQVKLLDSNATIEEGTATVVITANDAPQPNEQEQEAFVFALAVPDQHYTEGTAISALQLPEATGGQGDVSYRVFGLPAGLSFDPATRTIAGTPTKATDGAREVAFLAKDSSRSIVLIFAITVNPPMSFGDLSDLVNQAGKAGGCRPGSRWPTTSPTRLTHTRRSRMPCRIKCRWSWSSITCWASPCARWLLSRSAPGSTR